MVILFLQLLTNLLCFLQKQDREHDQIAEVDTACTRFERLVGLVNSCYLKGFLGRLHLALGFRLGCHGLG
ncbi:hypothetical protein D3C81_2298980 [compost metagenome]